MAIFHLPQFDHEPFWQYLSRFTDHCAQYVHFMHKNGKYTMLCSRG